MPSIGDPDDRLFLDKNDRKIKKIVEGNPEDGYAAFNKYCVSCHGRLANGKGPNAGIRSCNSKKFN